MMNGNYARVQCELGGKNLILETGHIARLSHGSCLATLGETQCFAAVCMADKESEMDFFPLTVDYREKTDAAGKVPGGFFKREGRPTTKEILTMRLIDRSIRPLFPKGLNREIQVTSRVFGYDGENPADVLAMIASFAALHISNIPFERALGAVRIGKLDDELSVMPSDLRRREESRLDLVVAGHADGIMMVEASALQLPEAEMLDALELARREIDKILTAIEELRRLAGQPKAEFVPKESDPELERAVRAYEARVETALGTLGKDPRADALKAVVEECLTNLTQGIDDEEALELRRKEIKDLFHALVARVERRMISEGRRADGRRPDEIRPITIVPDFIHRHHGSALFTRGETQALVSVTLGTPDDEQIIDGIEEEYKKNFYLHYNFPPFSVGEVRRIVGPGRREIGHGMLAERALAAVMPSREKFPYTVRIVSDILESNGSSSMATVCGGCLALMSAGVQISQPVAGIAMGLIQEDGRTMILSDIQGSEDHHGDMDFKVAGSGIGITALQMDIKVKGVTREVLERALGQARDGRVFILRKMLEAVPRPKAQISPYAPAMELIRVPTERIGFLIGPGGKNIKAMQEQYKVKIAVLNDEGDVSVAGLDRARVAECVTVIRGMTEMPRIGNRYKGTVKSVKEFGAFIEILPGTEGMCHISELAEGFVDRVEDVVSVGDEIDVVVINVDDRGKIKLSHRQAMAKA